MGYFSQTLASTLPLSLVCVCGAENPSQGTWEPGALRVALNLGGQATAGGALRPRPIGECTASREASLLGGRGGSKSPSS